MARPNYHYPAALMTFNQHDPHPETVFYTVLGMIIGGVFILSWIYYLLYKFNSDNVQYMEFEDEDDEDAIQGVTTVSELVANAKASVPSKNNYVPIQIEI